MLALLFLVFLTRFSLLALRVMSGVIEQRKLKSHDKDYVPTPPSMVTVLGAFEKISDPAAATKEQQDAVHFFHTKILAVLDTALTSDAMHGKSIMEVLDIKTHQMKQQQDKSLKPGQPEPGWEQRPNNWAMVMATGALFLDIDSGASDTKSIVHNLTVQVDDKKRKKKHFGKKQAISRCVMYADYYGHFFKIWLANRRGSTCKMGKQAANMAAWDKYTGMTKLATLSDAQKRANVISSICGKGEQENKKRKVSCLDGFGDDNTDPDYSMFLGMIGQGMPPLTGMDPEKNDILMEAQNKEVAANPTVAC